MEGGETQWQRAAHKAADDVELAPPPHGDNPSLQRKASICYYHLLYLSEHDQGYQVHAMWLCDH